MIKRIRNKIHAYVFWQSRLGDLVNKIYDYRLFLKYSFRKNSLKNIGQYEYFLTKQYHIIEKALGLPEPRPEFGQKVVNLIINVANDYIQKFGNEKIINNIASCLQDYLDFNQKKGVDTSSPYYQNIKNFVEKNISAVKTGGSKKLIKKDIIKAIDFDYKQFVSTRTSIRNFSDKEVTDKDIKKIFETARITPSVCNRQGWKAHVYFKPDTIKQLLTIQNGNRGFTNSINKLIVVTGDMRAFTTLESNQIYIDGGLFAMNILFSIHHAGLGAVALNTCFPYVQEKKVRKIANLEKYEKLIMMIGIGHIKDSFKVAMSDKKEVNQILQIHK